MLEGFHVLCHFAGLAFQTGNIDGQPLQMLGLAVALFRILAQLVRASAYFLTKVMRSERVLCCWQIPSSLPWSSANQAIKI